MKHVAYILLVKYASMLCNNIFRKKNIKKTTLSGGKYVSTAFTDIVSQYEGNYRQENDYTLKSELRIASVLCANTTGPCTSALQL